MIDIKDKRMCCGCSACVQVCPAECIHWQEDGEGFAYPVVDLPMCMHCDKCEDVCPMLHPYRPEEPLYICGAKNPDEDIRRESSSGGIFSLLAGKTFAEGGVVFAAAFDREWTVRHIQAGSVGELGALRGSKYLQSRMEDTIKEIEKLLREGRKVLFCGTSCQAAGLRKVVGHHPGLLITDVVCHSIPSPKVWKQYLTETAKAAGMDPEEISYVSFRDKSKGWRDFSVVIKAGEKTVLAETSRENAYMRGFLKGLYSRPACGNCPAKAFASGADLTIADLWGADEFFPDRDDDRGITLIFAITGKGKEVLENLGAEKFEVTPGQATARNPRIMSPAAPHPKREDFFRGLGSAAVSDMVWKYARPTLYGRIKNKLGK